MYIIIYIYIYRYDIQVSILHVYLNLFDICLVPQVLFNYCYKFVQHTDPKNLKNSDQSTKNEHPLQANRDVPELRQEPETWAAAHTTGEDICKA